MPAAPDGRMLIRSIEASVDQPARPMVVLTFDAQIWDNAAFDVFWRRLANGIFSGMHAAVTREGMTIDPKQIAVEAVSPALAEALDEGARSYVQADRERTRLQAELIEYTKQVRMAATK